jgi:hypothetical protein
MVLKQENPLQSVDEIIVKYLMSCTRESNYFDFITVGNTGLDFLKHKKDEKYLGSVANGVIRKTNLNIIFLP